MPDRLFFSLVALSVVVTVALALVWPQALGRRSPTPFGRDTAEQAAAKAPRLRPALSPAAPVGTR